MQTETIRLNIPKPSYIDTNGIKLHVMRAGHPDGDPIIMLHGFPEFWYGWHDYIEPLSEAGYHVIIPDQRGYNLSDKPDGIDAYRIETLVADIIGLIDHYGYDRVRLVAHDWGGLVAWNLAMWYPERVQQLVVANIPHPRVMSEFLRNNRRQQFKSLYAGFFQLPALPELTLRLNNWEIPSRFMRDIPGMTEREVRLYQQAWSQPGALTGMLNWYRAIARHRTQPPVETDGRIKPPTLIFWGKQDFALSHEMVPPSLAYCDDAHVVYFAEANHFVQHEKSTTIRNYMLAYFKGGLAAVRD